MKFGVVCASGLGDSLLMQIAARHLRALGATVTTFSDHLPALETWFPQSAFAPRLAALFAKDMDAVLLEHDNTEVSAQIRERSIPVYTLYASHLPSKHGSLQSTDFVFKRTQPMAHNIADAMQALFPGVPRSLDNGIRAPAHLTQSKFPKRVAIHPTSSSPARNWPRARFLALRERLIDAGWEPVFVTAPHEARLWGAPHFSTVAELAAFLYESALFIGNDSGPGHLASNLGLPTVTIGPNLHHHLDLWRPGWSPGALCTAPEWAMRFRITRTKWHYFISPKHVFKQFTNKVAIN